MGWYCDVCGQKYPSDAVVPTCCEDVECICVNCWNKLTNPYHISERLQALIIGGLRENKQLSEKLVEAILTQSRGKCPGCGKELEKDAFKFHGG